MAKNSIITIREALDMGHKIWKEASSLDIRQLEVLLAHHLGMERADLRVKKDQEIHPETWSRFLQDLEELRRGMPLAYLLGTVEFMSLPFSVDSRVLIPRPETETLVEEVLNHIQPHHQILDLGTGSGCIGLSLAYYGSPQRVLLADISEEALEVAKENAKNLGLEEKVEFRHTHLFSRILPHEKFDIITMNPPYIGEEEKDSLSPSLFFEPHQALFAPEGELYFYQRLANEAWDFLTTKGLLAVELTATKPVHWITQLFQPPKYHPWKLVKDLTDKYRVLLAWKG